MMTPTGTKRYFGKCLRCKATIVKDFQVYGGNKVPMVEGLPLCEAKILCACEGRVGRWEPLKARKTNHVCGAKCLASKGPTCDCSCGGENHGKSYVS